MPSSSDLEYVRSPDRDASASGGGGAPFCQVFHTILRLGTTVYGTQTPCTPHVPNANTSPDSDQYLIGSYARSTLALTATAVFPLSLLQRTVLFAPATDTDGRAQATLNNIDRGDLDRPGTAWSTGRKAGEAWEWTGAQEGVLSPSALHPNRTRAADPMTSNRRRACLACRPTALVRG